MRCPTLSDLPPPPLGKTGWPWTVETPPLPPAHADGSLWPRISIVTPSYNQGQFIEETVRSILLQAYPDLEYVIIDGGSTDQSVEIIRKYEPWLAYWVSEKDRGAPNAINKGLRRSTGSIFAWLNSDDIYREGVLQSIATEFNARPGVEVISGIVRMVSKTGHAHYIGPSALRTLEDFCRISTNWAQSKGIVQPEAFFQANLYRAAGPIREDLEFCYDAMFWISAADIGAQFASVASHWADFRHHPRQKTADLSLAFRELAHSVFSYCSAKPDMDRGQFVTVCSEVVQLLDRIATEERRYRESTSYKIGRLLTNAKFW
jgi:glycosyltransferase involved in cell wall biosynthesis